MTANDNLTKVSDQSSLNTSPIPRRGGGDTTAVARLSFASVISASDPVPVDQHHVARVGEAASPTPYRRWVRPCGGEIVNG
ncbi:MAG: hypothetical protein AAF467_01335 [Actinomycetota bacterium]